MILSFGLQSKILGEINDREKGDMTLTKAELAGLLFENIGVTKREGKEMVDGFFEEIRTTLGRGEIVKLAGFGNFRLRG